MYTAREPRALTNALPKVVLPDLCLGWRGGEGKIRLCMYVCVCDVLIRGWREEVMYV